MIQKRCSLNDAALLSHRTPPVEVRILSHGALPQELSARLRILGLFPGSTLQLLRRSPSGAVILRFRDTRMAFGAALASEIEVTTL